MVGKGSEEDRGNLLSVLPTERARGNGQKLKYMKFHLNMWQKLLLRECQALYQATREVVEISLDIFNKTGQDPE